MSINPSRLNVYCLARVKDDQGRDVLSSLRDHDGRRPKDHDTL